MKKFFSLFSFTGVIICFIMALHFTACHQSKPVTLQQQTDTAVVITSDYWDDIIEKVWPAVNSHYPKYSFYEANGMLTKVDQEIWGVKHNTFRAVFGNPFEMSTLLVYVDNDTLKFRVADEPWMGCLYMTPFKVCNLTRAVELIQKTVNLYPEGLPVSLSFSIFDIEPKWAIEADDNLHTVCVYSLEVDSE